MAVDYHIEIQEIWKPAPAFEQSYSVSNHGRIRRERSATNTRSGKILKPSLHGRYPSVSLCNDQGKHTKNIHRLVALAFLPNDMPERALVNHKDGNRCNNHVTNLEWCTAKENERHKYNVLHSGNFGSKNNKAKLTEKDIPIIRQRITDGVPLIKIAAEFNVSDWPIHCIKFGKTWKHVG